VAVLFQLLTKTGMTSQKVKFLTLVVSPRELSQLAWGVSFTTELNVCIYYNIQTFLELRYVSMRYDKHQKFYLKAVIFSQK
jgi:hypothetical protein